jgi:hypothetical protein
LHSANAATVTVAVAAGEAITITKSRYIIGKVGGATSARWVVTGTDSVLQGQTLSIVYNNGAYKTASGNVACTGNPADSKCVVGTTTVDALGNYSYDVVSAPGGYRDPNDSSVWASKPTVIKVLSTAPVLGGSQTATIQLK